MIFICWCVPPISGYVGILKKKNHLLTVSNLKNPIFLVRNKNFEVFCSPDISVDLVVHVSFCHLVSKFPSLDHLFDFG